MGEGEGKDGAESGKKAKRARASDANSHEPASDAPKNKPAAGASGEAVGGKRKRLSEGEGGGLHEDPEANLGRCVLYQGQTGTSYDTPRVSAITRLECRGCRRLSALRALWPLTSVYNLPPFPCAGTLIRYQQRQGKYRVKLEDGKEVRVCAQHRDTFCQPCASAPRKSRVCMHHAPDDDACLAHAWVLHVLGLRPPASV